MVKSAQRRTDKAKDLITIDDASKRLGLAPDFLKWALDNDFLAGVNQNDGQWRLHGADLEAGFKDIDAELAARDRAAAPATDPREGRGDDGAALDSDPDAPAASAEGSLLPEVFDNGPGGSDDTHGTTGNRPYYDDTWNLGQDRLDAAERLLAEKDALIADLSRALARLAEQAMTRLPVERRHDDS